jgi:hypothetical protein
MWKVPSLIKEGETMRVVKLCVDESCPVVEIGEDYVKIGEADNHCILKPDEWRVLKDKIINGEL